MEMLKTPLQLGANIQAKNACGYTPLHLAATNGHVVAMKTLLQPSADIHAKADRGATPLHASANYGHVEAVKTLLQLGAQLGARTVQGETPLDICVPRGHQVAQVLRHFVRPARPRGRARRGAQPTTTTREHTPVMRDVPWLASLPTGFGAGNRRGGVCAGSADAAGEQGHTTRISEENRSRACPGDTQLLLFSV